MARAPLGWLAAALVTAGAAEAQPPTSRPQGQIPDLGRPTESTDEIPRFDYDRYFPGTWTFEWRTPASPLGGGGMIQGRETFAPGHDGRTYASTIEATGPDGPFTVTSTIVYLKEQRVFTRLERDSRGFDLLKAGRVGGDLGGFYTIHYESAPVEVGGAAVRVRNITRIVSPFNFKVESRISVDGGPWTNFGTGWWRKADAADRRDDPGRAARARDREVPGAGPVRAPDGGPAGVVTMVMMVGCVEATGAGRFVVTRATAPRPLDDRLPDRPAADAPLGTVRTRLIGTLDEFGVARHDGHKVWLKGLFIDDMAEPRLNLVSVTHLADVCR